MKRLFVSLAVIIMVAGCTSKYPAAKAVNSVASSNPLNGEALYVSPNTPPANQVTTWQAQGNTADANTIRRISTQQEGFWLANSLPATVRAAGQLVSAAGAHLELPLLVIYNLPGRDCGGYSRGGARSDRDYLDWIYSIAGAIGTHPALVVLEPDAVAQSASGCVPKATQAARETDLSTAIRTLRANRATRVYLDAGGPSWTTLSLATVARVFQASGGGIANGYALNVSNFETLPTNLAYAARLSPLLGGKHFVIDTSRNGNGPYPSTDQPWCNPPQRALGHVPTTATNILQADAYLWIKQPGISDGTCRGGPPAGQWWAQYALGLAKSS